MKYLKKQSPFGTTGMMTTIAHGKGSASGMNNSHYEKKNDGWICLLCYESVTPIHKVVGTGKYVTPDKIDPQERYLWLNKDTRVIHRKSAKPYGKNSYNYICVMKHFDKRPETSMFPVSNENKCEICTESLVEIQHPIFLAKRSWVNLKDSKPHFKRHRMKWVCIKNINELFFSHNK